MENVLCHSKHLIDHVSAGASVSHELSGYHREAKIYNELARLVFQTLALAPTPSFPIPTTPTPASASTSTPATDLSISPKALSALASWSPLLAPRDLSPRNSARVM